jgi:uncharacterized OB-fold protein
MMNAPYESPAQHGSAAQQDSVAQRYREMLGRGQAGWARCAECGRPHFYPREYCPHCLSESVRLEPAPTAFRVRSFTYVYRPQRPTQAELPVLIVAGEAEGVTIIAEGWGWNGRDCSIGAAIRLVTSPDERRLPVFVPAGEGTAP